MEWTGFVKAVLKKAMKVVAPTAGPTTGVANLHANALRTLAVLCEKVYAGSRRPQESKMMYDMVCGHSNFVPILFASGDHQERIKSEVLNLVVTLIGANPGDMLTEAHQLPLFLGAYRATLGPSDRAILRIVHLNEKHKPGRLGSFAPLLWGQVWSGY